MTEPATILIIDDDADYSCLLELALAEARVNNPIKSIHDGSAALIYLRQVAAKSQLAVDSIPALVLLDLRMPKISGLEVLRWIRNEPRLARVPVAVFTGVEAADEQSQALALGASSLQVKPFAYRELVQTARSLRNQYLEPHELKHAA